jgi:hypothetical protein
MAVSNDEVVLRLESHAMEGTGPLRVAGAILRAPGALVRDVGAERNVLSHAASLLAIAIALSAAYGAVLAMYAHAWWAVAKIPIVVVGSVLLCTPTLFVFNALGGSRLTYGQTAALALLAAATLSMILVGIAPIAWFFGVSTESFGFMTVLHAAAFAIGTGFGLRALGWARRYLAHLCGGEAIGPGVLALWSMLVVVVGLQMAHYLRPILLPGPFQRADPRGVFLEFVVALVR